MLTFVGDIHGNVDNFLKFAESEPNDVIQVGDFGFGFVDIRPRFKTNVSFIRGNHDSPSLALAHPNVIQDGHTWKRGNHKFMAVGGGLSIDKDPMPFINHPGRTEDVDWWADEELSMEELYMAVNTYELFKPDVMITHAPPKAALEYMFPNSPKNDYPSRTEQAFSVMFTLHRPKIWVFGHLHKDETWDHNGCTFQCVGENSVRRLDGETLTFS